MVTRPPAPRKGGFLFLGRMGGGRGIQYTPAEGAGGVVWLAAT